MGHQVWVEEQLHKAHAYALEIASETAVVMVVNVDGETVPLSDYQGFSISASFLKDCEMAAIMRALSTRGYYSVHFADESRFMSWVLSGGYDSMPRLRKIVYTSALAGIGPGRRTLVPAFCAHRRIMTMNPDAYANALNRNKIHWNMLLHAMGLNVPETWSYDHRHGWSDGKTPCEGTHVVGKATYEGNSIGLSRATIGEYGASLQNALHEVSKKLKQPMTVQRTIMGNEIEVPVVRIDDRFVALRPVQIRPKHPISDGIITFEESKFDAYDFGEYDGPSIDEIMRASERISAIFPFAGISRIDFRVSEDGIPFVIDVSGTPHLTKRSSVAHRFAHMGFAYEEMICTLVGLNVSRLENSKRALQSSDQN